MNRDELRSALHRRLEACDDVLAMWEAGSHAFNRADERSDLDIGVLAKNGSLENVWRAVEQGLNDVGGFDIRWANPAHIFKGMTQRVYKPTHGGRFLDLDVGVFEDPVDDLYLQRERHGRATILFDRTPEQRTSKSAFDADAHRTRMAEALHQEIMRWHLYREFVAKELARGRTIDAFGFYIAFAVRPVITVLGMLHRPDRFDYGFRYNREELPPETIAAIERLCYVASPDLLLQRIDEADCIFTQTVQRLKEAGVSPVDPKGVDLLSVAIAG